jgi:hypothetical protein
MGTQGGDKIESVGWIEICERRIESTDRDIDGIAYELYGLTEEEIAPVEGATG